MKTIIALVMVLFAASATAAPDRIAESSKVGLDAAHSVLVDAANFLPSLSFENQQYADNQRQTVQFCAFTSGYLSIVNAYAIRSTLPGYADDAKSWAKFRANHESALGSFGEGLTPLVTKWADALMTNPTHIDPKELATKINQACLLEFWHPQQEI